MTEPFLVQPERREQLTLDALDASEAIASGEWTVADARALLGDDLVHGLVLYAQLLETMLAIARAVGSVEPVRAAARDSARAWRKAS